MDPAQLKDIFAKASAFKEGDLLVGGTADEPVREHARHRLSSVRIGAIARVTFVEDQMSEALAKSIDRLKFREIEHLTIGQLKHILTGVKPAAWVKLYGPALPSEVIAAVVKTMSNAELSQVAQSVFNSLPPDRAGEEISIGSQFHFGSRIQPNSPGDDGDEVLFSVLEGLCYGCGDVVIGINPAGDELDTIIRLEQLARDIVGRLGLPTRFCVLSDMVKQQKAMQETIVDTGFQSLAGTSKALTGMLGRDADGLLELCRAFDHLYFETGQGSEVTNGAAEGVDMVTLEARCYGVARHIRKETGKWMIVNDVAGFIGPEVFSTGKQLVRACLEDIVMAKLHGITMGLDVCSTFHMGIHPAELELLTSEIARIASPAYMMAVPGNADPMLGYLTTSFREHPRLRKETGRQPASSMQSRLIEIGALRSNGIPDATTDRIATLYAGYQKAGGHQLTIESLKEEGLRKIRTLQERGCDLGYGTGGSGETPGFINTRLHTLFQNAREALYSKPDPSVIRDCCPSPVAVTTTSVNREDYLAHPPGGERISRELMPELQKLLLPLAETYQVLFVVSDGLNANAVNENLREVMIPLKKSLYDAGIAVCPHDVVITNSRVRAGYDVARAARTTLLVHFIGERPGTGLNQLSAYVTYGRNETGEMVFAADMDHSLTTAICSIHPRGKSPKAAVGELLRLITKALENRCTGVKLTG